LLSLGDDWPWLALAGLGLFHGVNPAMGWLFAVALGLHRRSERVVIAALIPIALGHALAIAMVVAGAIALGTVLDLRFLAVISGLALIGWAFWHAVSRHRHRVRFGMQTGLMGLAAWSFLMATAHGAGLMLLPGLLPLQAVHAHAHGITETSLSVAALAVATHSGAMLLATGTIAIVVYRWLDLAILKRAWINFDVLWTGMLILTGAVLVAPVLIR
jgi:hypothetical protein